MKVKRFGSFLAGVVGMLLMTTMANAQLVPTQFIAYTSTGIKDLGGSIYLKGTPSGGDLVQLIWAGADGQINASDSLAQPTGDDVLLGSTHIGFGLPSESDWDRGKFSAVFENEELFVLGNKVYIRA